jgi:DNA-nicking Smr family endonuclease
MQNISNDDLKLWHAVIATVTPLDNPSSDVTSSQPCNVRSYPEQGTISTTYDLHGLTIESAYRFMLDLVMLLNEYEIKQVRIITGKSGAIRSEFPQWMNTPVFLMKVSRYSLEGTGGSFMISLR